MYRRWIVIILLTFLYATDSAHASHFRGGVIMVRPKLGGAAREMEISYQISWTQSSSVKCDSNIVTSGNRIDYGGTLSCQYGCSGTIMSTMSFICTYYSTEDNWLFGEYHTTYTFNSVNDAKTVTIGYEGNAWADAIGGRWNFSITFSLLPRNDMGQINSSPQILPTPPLRLQQGCSYTIPLAITDPDNDTVQCRWAVGDECKGICDKLPGAILDTNTCTITYTANNGTGIKGVAVMVEDYAPGSSHRPLSSVALQFLVSVYSSSQSCSSQTEHLKFPTMTFHPSNETVFLTSYNKSINVTLTCMANETSSYYWERQDGSIPLSATGLRTNTLMLYDVQLKDSGSYRCGAFVCSICKHTFSNYASVAVINAQPPVFVSHPTPQHVNLTHTAIFTCNASGYNVSYQWTIGSGSFPSKVIGINSNTLVIPDVRSSDDDTYICVASNKFGNTSSNATSLIITGLPEVVVTSYTQSVEVTQTAVFTATVTGVGPFNYQWQKEGNNITGETGSTFIIYEVSLSDQANYSCYVSNNYGDSAVSSISLQVTRNLPLMTKHPISVSIKLENNFTNVSLICEADGAFFYYWLRQYGSIPSTAFGFNTNVLTLTNLQLRDSGYYQCVAINGSGSTKSKYAELNFTAATSRIITQPTDTSAAAPFSGAFTCSVSGYGYQMITWYKQPGILPHKHNINQEVTKQGVITSTLIIPNVTEEDVGEYKCQVWANNMQVNSEKANLFYSGIPMKPVVVVQPGELINLIVNNFNLSMQCGIYNKYSDYHWEKKDEQIHLRVQGVSSHELNIMNLKPDDSGEYRCAMSNSTGSIFSDYSLITVKVGLPKITSHPESVIVEANDVATFECSAQSYGTASITWKRLESELPITVNITVTESLNKITSVLRIEKTIGYYEGYYFCVIENVIGQVNSSFAYCDVTVPCPEMIRPPKPVVVHPDATVTFSCLGWSYGELAYEWNRNNSSVLPSSSTILSCNTGIVISNVQIMDEGTYCCIVSNECGNITRCAWLEVDTRATIDVQPQSNAFKCRERNVQALWIAATGDGPIHYQWQKYDPSSNSWIPPSSRAVNITSPNLNFSVIMEEDQGIYQCIVTNDDGSIKSDNVNITVYGPPSISYYSSDIVALEGDKVTFMCNATNDEHSAGPIQISWYTGTHPFKPDGKRILIHSKYDNDTNQLCSVLLLDPVSHTDSGEYVCRAFTSLFCYTENRINLTVEYGPRITISPPQSPYMVNVGTKLVLYCTAEGFPIPTIQWYKNNVSIPQESLSFYLASTDTPGTTVYTCKGRNNAGNMENAVSANIIVTVKKIEKCPTLNDPDNGKVYVVSDGTVAIFTCDNGFIKTGDSYMQCINGKWTSAPPKCQPS